MALRIFLARHGDTFAPGQPVLWAGSSNDLPLAPRGLEQARTLGRYLRTGGIRPERVFCGPLERTRHFAALAIEALGLPLRATVDPRLNELDYGGWSGLTNQQVIEQFGRAELEQWNARSIWPVSAGWGSSESAIRAEVRAFATSLVVRTEEDPVLVVSSNGRLRYFLSLIPGEFERRQESHDFKIGTGNLSLLTFERGVFTLDFWNRTPEP